MESNKLYEELGLKLRALRKSRGMTIRELAQRLNKSVPTISKYESGEVAIGIDVLLDLCRLYNIDAALLLPGTATPPDHSDSVRYGKYYEELLYLYWYNGELNRVRCALIDNRNSGGTRSTLYFDVDDPAEIDASSFIYFGDMTYSETGTVFQYTNALPPFDKMAIRIPSFTRKQPNCIGLMTTVSYYYQNIATKIIASAVPVKDRNTLLPVLKISNEEIKELRRTNFFIV
ncbi:MAG: helix-turn-helix transcriptional regulator [Mogibacterium sp.]|nr:helix-turn-helix transcriptional regulator [Mogibacterium sp.]